jgi:hypothetical protein
MIGVFAVPMLYVFYENPRLFVFGLLALNGVGVVIVSEYTAVEYLHRFAFDSPAYRVGKLLAGLSIAVVIVVVFQFVLRNPARTQVRKALSQ